MTSPTLDRILDAVMRVEVNGDIKFISESGQAWLRSANDAALPTSTRGLVHSDDWGMLQGAMQNSPQAFVCDARIVTGNLQRWVNVRGYELPAAKQFVMCLIDISPWKGDQSAHRFAAEHDELTGLPNRTLLKKTINLLTQDPSKTFCIAMLDLDGFKKVNDTFGHAMGDAVLIETTKRLSLIVNPTDTLARLGGDEFVVLLEGKNAKEAAKALASVLISIARPFDTAPHNAYLGVSIGLAEFPAHGTDYSVLMRNADMAMYESKNGGKNRISVYTPTHASVDFSIKSAIHNGIQEGEFYMEFQPQFDIDRKVVGAEALMRWTSRDFGRVSPDKFIPIVEESGLMPFLGKWALRYSCYQLKAFQALMPEFVMSVNVSPVQFSDEDFNELVLEAVQESGIDPKTLILEITESTMMQSQERTERALATLRKEGIRFSIDDFGTGFSSLAYLTRLPVSSIKIDKSFVRAIENETSATAANKKLISAMINLAHSIDLQVVAEGVETEAQFDYLQASGCNLIQGYLLGRPVTSDVINHLLTKDMKALA